jgi:hypothetical protein
VKNKAQFRLLKPRRRPEVRSDWTELHGAFRTPS